MSDYIGAVSTGIFLLFAVVLLTYWIDELYGRVSKLEKEITALRGPK